MSFVNVRYPSGHLEVIPVQPNVPLIKALETACSKRSLDASKHKLIYRKKPIDLSLPFRYSGLLNHANLELVAYTEDEMLMVPSYSSKTVSGSVENPVRVALRLEDGHRVEWKGSTSNSLWSVLENLRQADEKVAQLLSISSDGLAPCLVYINQQICGEEYLRAVKLAELGIRGGSVLLQLVRQVPPLTPPFACATTTTPNPVAKPPPNAMDTTPSHSQPQASQQQSSPPLSTNQPTTTPCEISVIFPNQGSKLTEPSENINPEPFSVFGNRPTRSMFGGNEDTRLNRKKPSTIGELLGVSLEPDSVPPPQSDVEIVPSASFKFPTESAGQNLSQAGKYISLSDSAPFCPPCDREMILYRRNLSGNSESLSSEDLPDDFFELTQSELRLIIAGFRKEGGIDAPLGGEKIKQESRSRFFAKYLRCIVIFAWSDDYVLQACFQPQERVSALYDFMKQCLADPRQEFQLYTTPPKVRLSDMESTLVKAQLVPMSQIHMTMAAGSPKATTILQPNLLGSITADAASRAKTVAQYWMTQRRTI